MSDALTSQVPFADPLWHHKPRLPYYKDSHYRLQRYVRQYVDEHIAPNAHEWEKQGFIPAEAVTRHASLGFLAASVYPIPKSYIQGVSLPAGLKADEWDEFHDSILIDEVARCGYLGVVWGINCGAAVGGPPLATYGTEEQQRKYLAPLLKGEQRHCLCVTEPAVGSDVAGLTTTATKSKDGTHYILNGEKKWVTQGQWADHALVATRTGRDGAHGISVFIVSLNQPGISRRKMENSGVHASGSAYIEFEDVKVPASNLLGKENQGFEIIMSTFTHERLWVGITALRLARVALHDSYRYALKRQTFKQPLFSNQVIRSKFTKMAGSIEPLHSFMEQLVYRSTHLDPITLSTLSALLKVQAAHNLESISREAQQVFGGLGYSRSGQGERVEQISRDVRVLVVSGGSEEILIDMIAKQGKRLAKL